jgi:hypothetical protein
MAGSQINASANRLLSVGEVAAIFGVNESQVRERMINVVSGQEYLSIRELAIRWRCSRGTVYNRLRACGAEVLDFAARGKKGKKAVHVSTVLRIEEKRTRRLL